MCLHRPVDTAARPPGTGELDVGLRAGEMPQQVDGVAARVHQRPTGEIGAVTDVARQRQREAHVRLEVPDLPQLARVEDGAHAGEERVVAVVERLDHDPAGARRRVRDRIGFVGVRRERLLAQDVFAGAQRSDRPHAV